MGETLRDGMAKSDEKKALFYNKNEEQKVAKLQNLLDVSAFQAVRERLAQSRLRCGFGCLFYGPPGTGKTETVYQLALLTGRDVMRVDISEIKSMWFGESEKRIKSIFDDYRACVKTLREDGKPEPILFFNEADAVISKRRTLNSNHSGPVQTENTIQNIILQELEDLDGILVAATNLTENLDGAFERRFLYKIEFKLPENEARAHIWKKGIPSLAKRDAEELAAAYRLSGGQIENICRKWAVDIVLEGTEPTLEKLYTYCEDESFTRQNPVIGFAL
jgi:SpoVK/Ycf46/Vps4 family AAA+-type ATPase